MVREAPLLMGWMWGVLGAASLLVLACTPARVPVGVQEIPEHPRLSPREDHEPTGPRVLRASLPTLLWEARQDGGPAAWRTWLIASSTVAVDAQGGMPLEPVVEELEAHPGLAGSLWTEMSRAGDDIQRVASALCAVAMGGESWLSRALDLTEPGAGRPGSLALSEARGLALVELGQPGEAARELAHVADSHSRREDLPLKVGRLFLAGGDARTALPWARRARLLPASAEDALLLLADIHLAALKQCRSVQADFDDKLVCQQVDAWCAQVSREDLLAGARRRRDLVAELLPTAEDRFFNHYDQARKVCYQWLLP